jgi:hypothetical protein
MEKITVNYYSLSPYTELYRGDTAFTGNIEDLIKPIFFAFNKEEAKEYGIVHKFQNNKRLNLLALDNIDKSFYDSVPEKIKETLTNNYGYLTGKRDSITVKDKELVKYLCDNNYDGYAITNNMPHTEGGKFHNEIAVCNMNHIKFMETLSIEDDEKKRLDDKHQLLMHSKYLKNSRKKKHRDMDVKNLKSTNVKLFGGNKKYKISKKQIKNKSKNRRKSIKQKKKNICR